MSASEKIAVLLCGVGIGLVSSRCPLSSGSPAAEAVGLLSALGATAPLGSADGLGHDEPLHAAAVARTANLDSEASPAWSVVTRCGQNAEPNGCDKPGAGRHQPGDTTSAPIGITADENSASMDSLLRAIEQVENASGNPSAVGDGGRAVGILQVWPITVADANRILGREEFTLADRLDPDRSRAIFWTITNHYSAGCSDEIKAKRWCNGPRGENKPGSAAYWERVRKAMEEQR